MSIEDEVEFSEDNLTEEEKYIQVVNSTAKDFLQDFDGLSIPTALDIINSMIYQIMGAMESEGEAELIRYKFLEKFNNEYLH